MTLLPNKPTTRATGGLSLLRRVDWIFLFFLLLVCNQAMLVIKLAGFAFIYLMRPNFRFGLLRGRLPLFYVLLPVVGLLAWALHVPDGSRNYIYAFGVGTVSWLLCLAASHQIRLSIEKKGAAAMDATLRVFTILNFALCIAQLVAISVKTGALNPYDYRLPFPYGMSSGDRVFGVLFENSTYNVMVSMMLMLYFIFRKSTAYAIMAAAAVLMVFSNFSNLIYIGILSLFLVTGLLQKTPFGARLTTRKTLIFRIWPDRRTVPLILLLMALLPAFYLVFSPQNFNYFERESARASTEPSLLNPKRTKLSGKLGAEVPDAYLSLWQRVDRLDYKKYQKPLTVAASAKTRDFKKRATLTKEAIHALVGKKLSFMETAAYLKSDVRVLLTGSGVARFSSLAAHRISGGDTGRIFRKIPTYKTPLYLENHGLITKTRLAAPPALYATSNWPESFYNQLAGEYGLIGVLLFLFYYIAHYVRRDRKTSYGLWAAAVMVPFALINYLFEAYCPILIMEALLELNAAEPS